MTYVVANPATRTAGVVVSFLWCVHYFQFVGRNY